MRDAVLGDAEAIVAVNAAGWRAAYRGIVDDERLERLPIQEWKRQVTEGLARPEGDSFTLVGELDGGFAGYCFVAAPGRDEDLGSEVAELVAIYVEPRLWRRGVGTALTAAAEDRAAARGYSEVALWTFTENEQALAFYESRGWSRDGSTRVQPLAGAEALRLRKRVRTAQ